MSAHPLVQASPTGITGPRDLTSRLGRFVPVDRLRLRPAGTVRAALLRLANAHLARRPKAFESVVVGNGFRMSGVTSDVIQRHVYVFGTLEPPLTSWLQSRLRPGDVFLDFGANVGWFTLLAARAVGPSGHVVAFECVPSILEQLRRNLADNGADNVTVRPVIAADTAGEGEVFVASALNTGMSGTGAVPGGRSEGLVPRVVAADAVPRELWDRVRVVKIDVEGDELAVLRGLAPLLDRLPAGASLVVEVSPSRLAERQQSGAELMRFLTSRGFSAAALPNEYNAAFYTRPRPAVPVPLDGTPAEQTDVIFTR